MRDRLASPKTSEAPLLDVPQNFHFRAVALVPLRTLPPFLTLFNRSITAATMIGSPTVASTKTSPNFPPSEGGTNLPHEIASL